MNIDERLETLSPEAKAFVQHQLRDGTDFELVERRKALQQTLISEPGNPNRKGMLLSVAALNAKISTVPTPEQKTAEQSENFIQLAQKLRNTGDEMAASRLLKSGGLTLEVLGPRVDVLHLKGREEEADTQYRIQRDQAIGQLQVSRNISKAEAERIFKGQDKADRNPLLRPEPPSPRGTLESQLKQMINRTYGLKADRPIG